MQPRMISYDEFLVMGVQVSGNPMTLDYRSIWGGRYMKFDAQLVALRADEAYYGVFFEACEAGVVDFVAGVYVAPGTDPIPGVVLRKVPAATYAAFDCTMATISQTWNAIMKEWLPASGYEYDMSCAGYEYYPTGSSADDAPVMIHIPVKEKTG